METGRDCINRPNKGCKGFTLVELLAVLGIVAILAGFLIPGLSNAKAKGTQMACLGNLRQLGIAWVMYANDNADRLVSNLGSTEILKNVAEGKKVNWSDSVLNWELDTGNTNTSLNSDSVLGIYVGRNSRIFKCPSDRVLSVLQRGADWTERCRSFSMNAMVGDAGEFTRSGSNVNNPYHHQFLKLGEFRSTSELFVFIEEHPDSVNDGYFLNRPNKLEWNDLPASWHSGAANLTYADGHAASRKWSKNTRKPAEPDGAKLPITLSYNESEDFKWLIERTSILDAPKGHSY